MSEIQHKSLKAELLYLIGRASSPQNSLELYEKAKLATEIEQVSKALANLQSDGKIVRAEGEGRARYQLAAGVACPAPAGKSGRSKAVQAADAARPAPAEPVAAAPVDAPIAAGAAPTKAKAKPSARCEQVSKLLATDAERLADAVLAKTKRQLETLPTMLESTAAPAQVHIHIHIEQIDFHLGGL